MILIDEMKPLRLYKRPFHLPVNLKNKRKGSATFLLTPNYESSKKLLNNPILINRNYYEAYYLEKAVTYFINNEGYVSGDLNLHPINEISDELKKYKAHIKYKETKKKYKMNTHMSDKKDQLSASIGGAEKPKDPDLGTPQLSNPNIGGKPKTEDRSASQYLNVNSPDDGEMDYNMVNEDRSAAGYLNVNSPGDGQMDFNFTNEEKEDDKKDNKKKKREVENEDRSAAKYLNVNSPGDGEMDFDFTNENRINVQTNEVEMNDMFIRLLTENGDSILYINPELKDEAILETAHPNYNYKSILYNILYKERIKTNKDIFNIYDKVHADVPYIVKTYLTLRNYKSFNTFVDLSFYNDVFFRNNKYVMDKAVDIYVEFLRRMITDKRLATYGYTNRTVFIPINDWLTGDKQADLNYKKTLNPLSVLVRIVKDNRKDLLDKFKGINFMFIGEKGYFKCDISTLDRKTLPKFIAFINKLQIKAPIVEEDPDPQPTKQAIVADVVAKVEDSQGVQINNLTGKETEEQKEELKEIPKKVKEVPIPNGQTMKSYNLDGNGTEIDKNELVQKIEKAAAISTTPDDTIEHMEDDGEIIDLIEKIADDAADNVKINATRASRINKLENEFLEKKVKGNKSVKQMITKAKSNEEIPATELKIDTVNDEWKNIKYTNFEKIYDPNDDIINTLYSLSKKRVPVSVRNFNIEDTSTSEDYVYTYDVDMEDVHGTRFNIKFDVPKLIDNKFMKLRGNEKTMAGQLTLLPISKTDEDTVQIVSNYKKIIIYRHYTPTGKSNVVADKVMKVLNKNEFKGLKIKLGDNRKICSKYQLPIDFIDFASIYNTIETPKYIIYFNRDTVQNLYHNIIDTKKGVPFAYDKETKDLIYYDGKKLTEDSDNSFALSLMYLLAGEFGSDFIDLYNKALPSNKYTYSRASILGSKIPVILVMALGDGLIKAMDKANIKYKLSEKRIVDRKSDNMDAIKFKDGYINYQINYASSLLMNGLKDCGTEAYSLTEINKRATFVDMLDNFGGRLLSDGLDNFYDLMIDNITEEVLEYYKLPTDYTTLLAYANLLLADNKYVKHVDMAGRRYRSNELIAGYAYQAIADSYGAYRTELRKRGKGSMKMKKSAVIDKIMLDPTSSDVSILNDLQLLENINAVSYKGLAGMNTDRGYGLDKRTYDESMINILGIATGFAGNVGLTRQSTLDMNVKSKRGYLAVSGTDKENMNVTKTLTATEALIPFGTTRDDPFRQAMGFIQTAKHSMRIKHGSPSLITNGTDQALPYLTPNIFSFKSKDDGVVEEKTDDYMILKYKNGTTDFVDLRNQTIKNSNGGFYGNLKLSTKLKQGSKFKAGQVLAHDPLSYSDKIGKNDNVAYITGATAKLAILSTDEGFEDSAIIDERLSQNLTSEVVVKKDIPLPKDCNVYNMVKKGQKIKEGEPLLIFQNAYEDNDINILLKNLAGDEKDISDLGRIKVKSKITGYVSDIKIYRTVDLDELSPSLKKIVKQYEAPLNGIKKTMAKHGLSTSQIESTDVMDATGKLKNAEGGVYIEFYLCYQDKMSVGDKLIYYTALKGTVKDIFPLGKEPRSEFRPDEPINALLSIGSVNGRMVCSIKPVLGINKALIELDRAIKSKLGLKWTDLNKD